MFVPRVVVAVVCVYTGMLLRLCVYMLIAGALYRLLKKHARNWA